MSDPGPEPAPTGTGRVPLDPGESAQIGALLLDVKWIGLGFAALVLLGCVALWDHVPRVYLGAWVAVFCLEAALRFHVSSRYARASAEERRDPRWRTFVRGINVYTGIVYGLTALVLLLPLPKENFVLLACVFAGTYCLVCALSNYYSAVLWLSGVSMLLPLWAGLLLTGRPLYVLSAVLIGFMGALVARMARRTTRALSAEMASAAEHERLRETAERAVVEKSRFIAAISHDLRQPLHAMGLYHALLRERCTDAEPRRLADMIGNCIAALTRQFDSLLDLSRLDAGMVRPELRHADAAALVERLRERFAAKAEAKGLALEVESDPSVAVFSDPALLERILSNLLSNAIECTERGGVTVRVGAGKDDTVAIEVADTGAGIAAGELDRVFDEYYRLREDGADGFGLGLAIVSRLSALLDAEIDVESAPGVGTRFRLAVPAGHVREAVARDEAPRAEADLAGLAALVVDDDPDVLDGMRRTLESWGCEVRTAGSADEAVERLADETFVPDVLLCDYRLGDGANGIALAGRLRTGSRPSPAIIVITGDSSRERLAEIDASGFELLHKPVAPSALREAIASATA